MSKSKGFVLLFRDIRNHWLWEDKPFSKGQAFIDLVLRAHHKAETVLFEGKLLNLERGEILTSILGLSEAWGWSRHKVKNFLELLEKEQTIVLKTDNKKSIIKVLNYDVYQIGENQKGHQKDIKRTSEGHQGDIKRTQSNNYRNNYRNNEEINSAPAGAKKSVLGRGGGHTDF